ncbi:helix-turn-helix transcriptional regulator [Paenibacillus silvae]|uniref:Helix-turn-helix transcriptional regulator n=1 Tax=Paenibacillus silvae TaxID=1325358 RepID=A0ABQ1ZAE9_9BACL|nr:helix-turn-helix transcriptional regulator [Paenibacillus silvae]GGH53491.1 helix-turn-helix transcriptional regulator [Paenibacillus silvae]
MSSLLTQQNLKRMTSLENGSWTSRTYREAVLKQIKTLIAYDAYCFNTVDPSTLLSTGAVTEDGIEAIHKQLFLNEYMEDDVHKYADLIQSGQYTAILQASLSLHSHPETSSRYANILLPAGIHDELRTVFVDQDACWGHLTLYRKQDAPAFTEEERLLMQHWTASIAFMLRTTRLSLTDELTGKSPDEPGIMLLDTSFEPVMNNAAARYWVSELHRLEQVGHDVLPRPIRAVCSHLLQSTHTRTRTVTKAGAESCAANGAGKDTGTSSNDVPAPEDTAHPLSKVCVQLSDGRYLMLHASRMQQPEGIQTGDQPDHIAVWLEQAMPQDVLPLLCERYGLSARERELLAYVLRSFSSKEIAAAMHISVYTVQDHLKSIFAKTEVSSRRELIWHFVSRFQLTGEL